MNAGLADNADASAITQRRYRGDYVPLKRRGKSDYRKPLIHLRRGLFVLAALLLLYVGVKSNWNTSNWQVLPEEVASTEDLTISVRNARYAGLDAGKLPFSITADEIIQDKSTPDELQMVAPKADITLNNGQWIFMSADNSVIETNGSRMVIEDNVNITFSNGYELTTDQARMNMRLGIILGDAPVAMQGVNFNFTSAGFRIHNSGQNIALLGPANLLLREDSQFEISAAEVLEWHRDKGRYSATGKVIAKNENLILRADKLDVFYENIESSKGEKQVPTLMKAYDKVQLETSGGIIYADSAVYDIPRKFIKLFGNNVYLDSSRAELNAGTSLEYWSESEIAIARGGAEVKTKGGRSLEADTIRAKISLLNGNKQISYATAEKNVVINTGDSRITGNDGRYDFTTQQGKICGNLKIIEKDDILSGECATIDMRTGISQIENNETNGRVRGSFGIQE